MKGLSVFVLLFAIAVIGAAVIAENCTSKKPLVIQENKPDTVDAIPHINLIRSCSDSMHANMFRSLGWENTNRDSCLYYAGKAKAYLEMELKY